MFDADPSHGSLIAVVATVALALLAGPVASPAVAHGGATELTFEASEDCPDSTYCFDLTNGSLEDIETGENIDVTVVNPEDNGRPHNLQVAPLDAASEDRETSKDEAGAGTENLEPGEQTSFEYFVPNGADGLYFWCSFGAHESQGMYVEAPFDGDSSDGSSSDGEQNGSPGAGVLGLLAAAGAALAIQRRR